MKNIFYILGLTVLFLPAYGSASKDLRYEGEKYTYKYTQHYAGEKEKVLYNIISHGHIVYGRTDYNNNYDKEYYPKLHWCGSEKYLCVQAQLEKFAVPRGELKVGYQFNIDGTVFKIMKCTKYSDGKCTSAFMKSDCQHFVKDRSHKSEFPLRCVTVEGGREKSPLTGPLYYYEYSKDRGIVSIGTRRVNKFIWNDHGKTFIITRSTLISKYGLFHK